jgi:hypothetical protein
MRTTIDLPDELLRQVKARAALDGLKLKDLIMRYVAQGLRQSTQAATGIGIDPDARPRRTELPVTIPAAGRTMPALSNGEIETLLEAEDAAHALTSSNQRG